MRRGDGPGFAFSSVTRVCSRALLIIEQIVQAHDGAPAMPAIVAHWPSNSLDASADAC